MPKLKMTVFQYFWCWTVLLLIWFTPLPEEIGVGGLFIYLYKSSISLIAISMLLKYGGRTYLVFGLSTIEILAVLLQLAACYANLTKEINWFYANYRGSLENLFYLEVLLLTIAGFYGFGLLLWNTYSRIYRDRGGDRFNSVVYAIFFKQEREQR